MSDPQGILDWINALPDSFAHPASQTKPTKAPPTVNKRKLQEPSPPRTILNMAETSSPKRQRMLDPENDPQLTPRARHETATCPSRASSASASQTSSLSRSSSPLKRQIMRLHLDNTGLELRQLKVEAPPNPQAGELLETLLDISRGLEFLPDDRRAEILGSPALRGKPGREWRFAFKSASELGNLPGRMPSPEEVALVYEWASVCHDIGNEEAGWNEDVHHRLLEAVFREPGTTKGGLLNFTSCTTARPHKNWLPKCTGAKMVDYCIYLDPNQEGARSLEAHQKLCGRSLTLSVNHIEFQRLRLRPIVLSIETKGPAQGLDVAEVQMGVWHAAQWSFLRSAVFSSLDGRLSAEEQEKQTDDAISRLPFIPGIIIQGHKWLFMLSTRQGAKTIFWTERQFGSTQSVMDIYQVVAGLRELAAWAEKVYLPWFRRHVLALAEVDPS